MSLRISRTFGHRSSLSEIEQPIKKYIFVFEGEKTEKQYFEGLFNQRVELQISDIIEISTFDRVDPTLSNQLKVVQALDEQLHEVISLKKSVKTTVSMLEEIFIKHNVANKQQLLEQARAIITTGVEQEIINFIEMILDTEIEDTSLLQLIEKLTTLQDFMGYEKDFDTVCIIIDRDKQSFKKDQFEQVLKICEENRYSLGVSNPCFEFWLLLHLTDCTEYDITDIQTNRRVSKKSRYLERLLSEQLGKAYKKNRLNFNDYKKGVRDSIERATFFCQDNTRLENEAGSSVGIIVNELFNS